MLVRMKRGPKQKPRRERFYERVDRGTGDGCWIWTGAINQRRGGYGYFYDDDTRLRRAHRVAWELEHGPLPEDVALMQHLRQPCLRACVAPGAGRPSGEPGRHAAEGPWLRSPSRARHRAIQRHPHRRCGAAVATRLRLGQTHSAARSGAWGQAVHRATRCDPTVVETCDGLAHCSWRPPGGRVWPVGAAAAAANPPAERTDATEPVTPLVHARLRIWAGHGAGRSRRRASSSRIF